MNSTLNTNANKFAPTYITQQQVLLGKLRRSGAWSAKPALGHAIKPKEILIFHGIEIDQFD